MHFKFLRTRIAFNGNYYHVWKEHSKNHNCFLGVKGGTREKTAFKPWLPPVNVKSRAQDPRHSGRDLVHSSTSELIYELETYVLVDIFSNVSALSLPLCEKEIDPEDWAHVWPFSKNKEVKESRGRQRASREGMLSLTHTRIHFQEVA